MKEFKVHWVRFPLAYNDTQVLFIEAESPGDAKEIATNHIERRYGIPRSDFRVGDIGETAKAPPGRVICEE